VHSVARHIIDSALKAVAEKCANVSCPVLQQRCDWIEDHQAEFTGVLAVELRPITDGFMVMHHTACVQRQKELTRRWQDAECVTRA